MTPFVTFVTFSAFGFFGVFGIWILMFVATGSIYKINRELKVEVYLLLRIRVICDV